MSAQHLIFSLLLYWMTHSASSIFHIINNKSRASHRCSGSRHILSVSMQGKPLLAAIGAAESRPPVLSVPYFHEDAAVPAAEGVLYGLGLHVFGMLPVQPLAMGRAEFSPLIRPLRHDDPLAAADAAEGAQHLSSGSLRRRRFVLMAMPVRIAPADGAAISMRRPVRHKLLAADGADCFPFHSLP